MPSSINRFPVISTDNKTEDKCFVFTIIAILLLAATLLFWLVKDDGKEINLLPKEITPVINQLSSTADEISFLIAAELLPKHPNLLQLQQEAISPFDSRDFSSPLLGCFITDIKSDLTTDAATHTTEVATAVVQYQVALWLDDKGYRLAWRAPQSGHGHHHDEHDETSPEKDAEQLCQQTGQGWQFIEDNITENNIDNISQDNTKDSAATAHS